ncbi:glycosyltransferase [Synechococcus sp. ATX 2A4]|uniref:glycosyltransferase n=1 Tax=Synechococcus sp. ATX 2A4 TaxID=2823727 RepID=UPI0020CF9C33|nr:glycosyltransferase [Synechococcus sp. ATX 2A4]MCP9884161.1 glycosyltransferase [Synechococcus sp. ATX 2A4]
MNLENQSSKEMISVLMCTYNGARWLPAQLNSLLSQTLQPCELVVCDDGSTDDTLSILDQFKSVSPFPVQVIVNDVNLGYALNFLTGIAFTKAQYVAFCDHDDVWYPDKLKRSLSVLKQSPSLLITHGFDVVDDHGDKISSTVDSTGYYPPLGYRLGPVDCAGFSILMDKRLLGYAPVSLSPEFFIEINGKHDKPAVGHDELLCVLASALHAGVFIPEPLVAHIEHGSNSSRDTSKDQELLLRSWIPMRLRLPLLRWSQRGHGSETYSQIADSLEKVACILDVMVGELLERGCSADYVNHRLSTVRLRMRDNRLRASLYSGRSNGLLVFARMLQQGCYRKKDSGLGFANACKDFLVASVAFYMRIRRKLRF